MKPEDDPARLREVYEQWPTRTLVLALTDDRSEYGPTATAMMRQVLESRGVGADEWDDHIASVASEDQESARRFNQVRGWLLFLIFAVAARSLAQLLAVEPWLAVELWRLRSAAVLSFVAGLYGLLCAVALARREPAAPLMTVYWLIGTLVVEVVFVLTFYSIAGQFAPGPLRAVYRAFVFGVACFAYLSSSRRVAMVYFLEDRAAPPTQ